MISQSAQTNGSSGPRRLIKSLSEMAKYEGLHCEIYDLDDIPTPPPPPRKQPPAEEVIQPYRARRFSMEQEYSESASSDYDTLDYPDALCAVHSHQNVDPFLKSHSEEELKEKLSCSWDLPPEYLRDETTEYSSVEDIVQYHRNDVSPASSQVSGNKSPIKEMFKDEMMSNEPQSSYCETELDISCDSRVKSYDRNKIPRAEHELWKTDKVSQLPDNLKTCKRPLELSLEKEPVPLDSNDKRFENSPTATGSLTDTSPYLETGEHYEESVSESQVTVIQRPGWSSSQGQTSPLYPEDASDQRTLTDHCLKTTSSDKVHVTMADSGNLGGAPYSRAALFRASASNLSSISDEQTSISENVISDNSQSVASITSTPNEVDRPPLDSPDNDNSLNSVDITSTVLQVSEDVSKEPTVRITQYTPNAVAKGGREGHIVCIPSRLQEIHKLTSPESDSASSHLTEPDTSRSPASSGTTVNSKSDLSKTDSHTNTDHSEISDDYVTANEISNNGAESRKTCLLEEKLVSPPPRMEDILEDDSLTAEMANGHSVSVEKATEGSEDTYVLLAANESIINQDSLTTSSKVPTALTGSQRHHNGYGASRSQEELVQVQPMLLKTYVLKDGDTLSPDTVQFYRKLSEEEFMQRHAHDRATKCLEVSDEMPANQREQTGNVCDQSDEENHSQSLKNSEICIQNYHRNGKQTETMTRKNSESETDDSVANVFDKTSTEEDREKLKLELRLHFTSDVTTHGTSQSTQDTDDSDNRESVRSKRSDRKPKKSVTIDVPDTYREERVFIEHRSSSPFSSLSRRDENATNRSKKDKLKKQVEDLPTPGMVRSPAMHEGFRLEDWTPIRTPGTPERAFEVDTSDDSLDDIPVPPSRTRSPPPKKSKEIFVPKSKTSTKRETINGSLPTLQSYETGSYFDQKRKSSFPRIERKRDSPASQICSYSAYAKISSSIPERVRDLPYTYDSTAYARQSPPRSHSGGSLGRQKTTNIPANDIKRQSEDVCRTFENFLDPGMGLKKADSLRSFSPGSDNVFLGGSAEQLDEPKVHLCVQCGERPASRENIIRPSPLHQRLPDRRLLEKDFRSKSVTYRARSEERSGFTRDWSTTAISLESGDHPRNENDDDERGCYVDAYRASPWLYIGPGEELMVWRRDSFHLPSIPPHVRIPGFSYSEDEEDDETEGNSDDYDEEDSLKRRRNSPDMTCSESEFRRRYQAITHRMIHRKASVEMYRRLLINGFHADKSVLVVRDSGEFGFRIHGSRPVVVSAIESRTPAEASGLEVGDIVMAINDVNVLDASHSDVVKLAHAGADTLRLDVARTCDVLTPLVTSDPIPICAGYLYKLGSAHSSQGSGITRKWRRRWFALKKDHCLYYYKSEKDQIPVGAVNLVNYSVHSLGDVGRPFAFTVAKFGGSTMYLAAHSEEARKRWGQVITHSAAYAAQRDDLLEESARRIQQSPGAITSPDCFGYLFKLGSRWHQWKKRYCVLKDACLFLYQDADATQAIGVVHVHGYRVQSTSIGGRKHAFELLPPDPRFRHFYFHTDSESDKKRWLAGLEYSIDRWIKAG